MLYTDTLGIQQYATNSLLFLKIIQDKYISLYRELVTQLHTYISAIRILTKLVMYFTINLAFTNYLGMLPNLTDSLPITKVRTKYEQTLPLNLSTFDSSLRHAPTKLKDIMNDYINNKE